MRDSFFLIFVCFNGAEKVDCQITFRSVMPVQMTCSSGEKADTDWLTGGGLTKLLQIVLMFEF